MRCAALSMVFILFCQGVSALPAEESDTVSLTVRGNRVTLRAVDAPLPVVLQRLAVATGIALHIMVPVDERVSMEFADVELKEGLQRLLQRQNSAFLYSPSAGTLAAIYVLGPHGGTSAPPTVQAALASAVASTPPEDSAIDLEAARHQTSLKINALEERLRAVSMAPTSEASDLSQELMADPDQAVRITALQWLARQEDSGDKALAIALHDGDDLVQRAALQIIFEQGASEEAIEAVRAAAEAKNDRAVQQILSSLRSQ